MSVSIDINSPSGWHDAKNITLVLAEGTAVENGQRLLDTYASIKLQGGWTSTNKMNITLQPGEYDLGTFDLKMDVPWVNLCALVVNSIEPTVKLISSFISAIPPIPEVIEITADNVSIVGIEVTSMVVIGNLSQSQQNINLESCKGGDFFGISLLDGHVTFKNCTALDYLGYCIRHGYNTMVNCVGGEYLGQCDGNSYLKASYCYAGSSSYSANGVNYGEYRYCSTTDDYIPDVTSPGLKEYCTDNRFEIAFNLEVSDTFTYIAPKNFAIDYYDNPSMVAVTIKVNGSILNGNNTPINKYDVVTVDVSAAAFLILHCYTI